MQQTSETVPLIQLQSAGLGYPTFRVPCWRKTTQRTTEISYHQARNKLLRDTLNWVLFGLRTIGERNDHRSRWLGLNTVSHPSSTRKLSCCRSFQWPSFVLLSARPIIIESIHGWRLHQVNQSSPKRSIEHLLHHFRRH